jgi:DNA-binding transcriptional LysR family regulator
MTRYDASDLAAFVAVAKARGFRQAAKLTGRSASSLSDAVRRLEIDLDLRLFNRTTRSVTATPAAQQLFDRLSPTLSALDEAIADVVAGADQQGGTLRLNVPGVVAELVLPDLLPSFLMLHPAIRVEVVADNNFVDVLAAGFDAGVRYGERLEKDMIAIPIGPRRQRFVTAASPAYLAAKGRPKHPNDLLRHACIRFRFPSGVVPPWDFEKDGESVSVAPDGPIIASGVGLQIAAARAGLGVIHAFEGFLSAALTEKSIEPILEDWSERFPGPFLYFSSRLHMPPALRNFVDFVKSQPASTA